jgi:hypothetical protein
MVKKIELFMAPGVSGVSGIHSIEEIKVFFTNSYIRYRIFAVDYGCHHVVVFLYITANFM